MEINCLFVSWVCIAFASIKGIPIHKEQCSKNENFIFVVDSFKRHVELNDELEFYLSFQNNSNQEITIPAQYIVGPQKSIGSDVIYEINLCTKKDTINSLDSIITQVEREFIEPDMITVKSMDKFKFSSKIKASPYIFRQKGIYRVRFTLLKNKQWGELENNISTQWVYVSIE